MILRRAAVALCCGALVLLPGCGSSNKGSPIPASTADRLNKNIAAADSYSSQGLCTRAHTKVRDARFVSSQIPSSVSKNVRQGIDDGLAHLDSLISSQCASQTTTTQTQTTQSNTTPTQSQTVTTQTQTTPTTTATTPTTTSTTPTTTSTTPTSTDTTPTSTGNGGTPTVTGTTGATG